MPDPKKPAISEIEAPPTSVFGILRRLGPGLIIAASIVGSGELIATTLTGARAGFWLMWLILIGCVIKVFTQIEFGRYSIVNGKTTMDGLNRVPGPSLALGWVGSEETSRGRGNWLLWYWFIMFLATLGQLGGIIGGVGQAMAISLPLTQAGREFNAYLNLHTELKVKTAEVASAEKRGADTSDEEQSRLEEIGKQIVELKGKIAANDALLVTTLGSEQFAKLERRPPTADDVERVERLGSEQFEKLGKRPPTPRDEILWATLIAVITSVLLYLGRYNLVQNVSTFLVVAFTVVTVVNVIMLQFNPTWAVQWGDLLDGFRFRLPPETPGGESKSLLTALAEAFSTRVEGETGGKMSAALLTALATFGIIGVGANELISYPYWCLEKGYARFTGPRDASPEWAERARGWMRVMRWDAWCSMVIYTFATLAFYLLGAAVLGRSGLNPANSDLLRTLAVMYEPVFGKWAEWMFLFGAFAVLYSTYYVASAGHARVCSDAFRVMGFVSAEPRAERKRVQLYSGLFPLFALAIYIYFPKAVTLVLLGGLMQAFCLPMLAAAAIFFRYYRCDARIRPGTLWDVLFWISALVMTLAGLWAAWAELNK